jgi:hypothetical protein
MRKKAPNPRLQTPWKLQASSAEKFLTGLLEFEI